jgi:hypothetical protein
MATGHTGVEWETVRALVIVFDTLDRLEEVLEKAQLTLAPRHRLGLYNGVVGLCGGDKGGLGCVAPFTLQTTLPCVHLFLHVVALANVMSVRQPPLTTLKDPLRMLRHVAVNALATPGTLLLTLVAERGRVAFLLVLRLTVPTPLEAVKDLIRSSTQVTLVGILGATFDSLQVTHAARALRRVVSNRRH